MSIIESMTRQAAHRRDHGFHNDPSLDYNNCASCFEIIFLGTSCFCVCHDCGFDTPLVPEQQAEGIKAAHCCPQC
jgi:hypothetical protein